MEDSINYKGFTINIEHVEYADNPRREWDNATKMICFHRRYYLGDKHDVDFNDYNSFEELKRAIVKKYNPIIIKTLYLYDHSGITISTSSFNDRWDSGCVGFVVFTREEVLSNFNVKRITKTIREKAEKLLDAEVEIYDNYLTGAVYCYTITNAEGEEIDSCSGYYGYDHEKNGLLDTARDIIDCKLEKEKV